MKSYVKKALSGTDARFWIPCFIALGLLSLVFAGWLIAGDQRSFSDLTVHEWGTFTAIAGTDGRAVEWTPLTGSTDLPSFVEHLSNGNFKIGLRGKIRMETPVLYFYSPRDANVSVKATFSKGLITEWYPRASRVQPTGVMRDTSLSRLSTDGSIMWNDVAVSPNSTGEFPHELASNRYYAARDTSSAPIRVKTELGAQQEKFLFYRGVSASPLPISAKQNSDGTLLVKSLNQDQIPAIILFERRGERFGYYFAGSLTDETMLDPPVLTGSLNSFCGDLERILIDQGLYADEAHAMVETWRDSWFEEGTRVLYVVPRKYLDQVLPLTVSPAPEQVVRVFVGRLEIVTPATASAVKTALVSNDEATLDKYRRFLEPIQNFVKAERTGANR